jgi:hypothetical protein
LTTFSHPVQRSTKNRSHLTFVRPQTLKLLEENIAETLQDTGTGDNFLDRTPKEQKTQQKFTMGLHQTRKFLCSKGSKQHREDTTYRIKDRKNRQKILINYSQKNEIQMVSKYTKNCSISSAIKEM